MSFEEWYKTYERDGGELMLYNTIDLEAAYSAGAQAERERCARVAESDDTVECWCSSDYECNHCAIKNNIAAAIRGQDVNRKDELENWCEIEGLRHDR